MTANSQALRALEKYPNMKVTTQLQAFLQTHFAYVYVRTTIQTVASQRRHYQSILVKQFNFQWLLLDRERGNSSCSCCESYGQWSSSTFSIHSTNSQSMHQTQLHCVFTENVSLELYPDGPCSIVSDIMSL